MARQPDGPPPPPVVQRLRVRYAKRGRLRFTSHRDFARALERAVRRAGIPIGFSAGFSPHPKISYVGAAPTGVSSDAEYLELGLSAFVEPAEIRSRLDAALPDGLDIVEVVAVGTGSLPDRIEASVWRVEVTGADGMDAAVAAFNCTESLMVERLTKTGRRDIDARAAVVSLEVSRRAVEPERAILDLVVRQAIPSVRPDDVLAALRTLGASAPSEPVRAIRLAQGPLEPDGSVADPLAADRDAGRAATH